MLYDHKELDGAIAEIDRARKLLGKLKIRQIRNSEHRDLLKATALSWFRNRRGPIAPSISPELLVAIDRPYQCILDATERDSAKSTYEGAVKEAKGALLKARGEVLLATPTPRTPEAPPDFSPLASDAAMQAILTRRWEECSRCLDAKAPLAATVMMGGLLEALFVSRANKLSNKASLFASRTAPIDPKTKKPLDLRQWTLGPYIDVGHDLKWISRSAKDIAVILRDYRNYVHPEKERSHGVVLSQDDAAMFWEVTKTLSRELLAMKGTL
ncbi:MAG TPA: hypothetical protein VFB20_03955 [Burkholderiales bacterium]|nr:hypothetical protein [Burkholderiales bacterium]